jgi:N-hydroxyarylamine O-acetyltransferase
MSTTWGTPETLSEDQVNAYLSRIGLDPAPTRARPTDLALLRDVQVAHILSVPFDLSSIHLPSSPDESQYKPRGGPGMPLVFASSYKIVIEQHRGGYCFVLNGLFSALLRSLGFRTSQLSARVYPHRNKDPKEAGWLWTPVTHVCFMNYGCSVHSKLTGLLQVVVVADTVNEGRFLVDVGFGGGNCPFP